MSKSFSLLVLGVWMQAELIALSLKYRWSSPSWHFVWISKADQVALHPANSLIFPFRCQVQTPSWTLAGPFKWSESLHLAIPKYHIQKLYNSWPITKIHRIITVCTYGWTTNFSVFGRWRLAFSVSNTQPDECLMWAYYCSMQKSYRNLNPLCLPLWKIKRLT